VRWDHVTCREKVGRPCPFLFGGGGMVATATRERWTLLEKWRDFGRGPPFGHGRHGIDREHLGMFLMARRHGRSRMHRQTRSDAPGRFSGPAAPPDLDVAKAPQ
jgi:hypothetical protein